MKESIFLRCLKKAAVPVWFQKPLTVTWSAGLRGAVTCLLYHRIAEVDDHPWLEKGGVPYTSPDAFRRQLAELVRLGAEFLTLEQLESGRYAGRGRPGIVITFDDGFRDNFTVAQTILEDFGIHAVFFVIAALPERKSLFWEHRIYRLMDTPESGRRMLLAVRQRGFPDVSEERLPWAMRSLLTPPVCEEIVEEVEAAVGVVEPVDLASLYPTWDEVRAAADRGHQIGSHTVNHRMRHLWSQSEFCRELRDSKSHIEGQLGRPVTAFSFPFNSYWFEDEHICREEGYRVIASVDPGRISSPGQLDRVPRRTVFRIHDRLSVFRSLLARSGW